MTLHRKHHTAEHRGVRLSLRDQLDLQGIVLAARAPWHDSNVPDALGYHLTFSGGQAQRILQRHGVDVSLDEHTGRVTFNPEVVDA